MAGWGSERSVLHSCFLYTFLISVVAVTILQLCVMRFSYLIAISSELFLSQPIIFTFCASNYFLQPPSVGRGDKEREKVLVEH